MSRPLIFGSSHIGPLMKAPGEVPFVFKKIGDVVTDHRLAHQVGGKTELRPPVADWLNQNPYQEIVLSISGHNYLTLCLTEGDAPYDVILPCGQELGPKTSVQLIPFAEIRALLEGEVKYILDGVEAMAGWRPPGVRLWWMEAPPPIGDEAFLLDWIAKGGKHWQAFLSGRLSSPWLRMKMFLLQRQIIREKCLEVGIEYIFYPSSSADEDGFLLPEYALDVCHGNRVFGRLAVDAVLDALRRGHQGAA